MTSVDKMNAVVWMQTLRGTRHELQINALIIPNMMLIIILVSVMVNASVIDVSDEHGYH